MLLVLLLLVGCTPHENDAIRGLSLHQTVAVLGEGTADERRVQVYEDDRITADMRAMMWGGVKDVHQLVGEGHLQIAPAMVASLTKEPFRHAVLRLVDHRGDIIAERRLDCELGEITQPAIRQNDASIWAIGDDCSTGEGDYAGLITRFLLPSADRLSFETFIDAATGEKNELTLVTAARIRWHLANKTDAILIHEVSSHLDYDGATAEMLPQNMPWAVELVTYRWTGQGQWVRAAISWRSGKWSADDPWPDDAQFPANLAP